MRYIFGFMVFLLLIVLGLIFIFSGHKKSPTSTKNTPVVLSLPEYAPTDASVSMTTDGIVNGEDAHRAIRITVNRDSRVIDIIQGYSGRVIDSHTYSNTEDGYAVFLKSLNNAGFMTKVKKPTVPDDPRGYCADGQRTILKLEKNTDSLSNLWTSTCSLGNFGGNIDLIVELFRAQITDYDNLTANVEL